MKFLSERKAVRGFTLIELIIAVSIVAVIASIVIVNLQDGKRKARDTQRTSDLEQMRLVLRLYKDANGDYPDCDSGMVIGEGGSKPPGCDVDVNAELAKYMTAVPKDPKGDEEDYGYVYDSEYKCDGVNDNVVLYAESMEVESNFGKWKGINTSCAGFESTYGMNLK